MSSGPVDWRKILIAYINVVSTNEGIDFLPAAPHGLTGEELALLHEAAAETDCIPEHRADLLTEASIQRSGGRCRECGFPVGVEWSRPGVASSDVRLVTYVCTGCGHTRTRWR